MSAVIAIFDHWLVRGQTENGDTIRPEVGFQKHCVSVARKSWSLVLIIDMSKSRLAGKEGQRTAERSHGRLDVETVQLWMEKQIQRWFGWKEIDGKGLVE